MTSNSQPVELENQALSPANPKAALMHAPAHHHDNPALNFDSPPADPLPVLRAWLDEARLRSGQPNPNAMTLATVSATGQPAARIVLLKQLDERGAVFFTNRSSRKGHELGATHRAALLFHWDALDRQVRIEGRVTMVSDAESDAYFATRPRESRIGAWASQQSQPAANRAALDEAVRAMEAHFDGVEVPRPPHWGGYRVNLDSIEFWQGHRFRLHDRLLYTARPDHTWTIQRLFP
jgi:pyridoxamine 5'-phosphate oxidase